MKDITTFMTEAYEKTINGGRKYKGLKKVEKLQNLEEIATEMFKEYDSTWPDEELKDYVDGKAEPNKATGGEGMTVYQEMIDDLNEFMDEHGILCGNQVDKWLTDYYNNGSKAKMAEDIEIILLRAMKNKIKSN